MIFLSHHYFNEEDVKVNLFRRSSLISRCHHLFYIECSKQHKSLDLKCVSNVLFYFKKENWKKKQNCLDLPLIIECFQVFVPLHKNIFWHYLKANNKTDGSCWLFPNLSLDFYFTFIPCTYFHCVCCFWSTPAVCIAGLIIKIIEMRV